MISKEQLARCWDCEHCVFGVCNLTEAGFGLIAVVTCTSFKIPDACPWVLENILEIEDE